MNIIGPQYSKATKGVRDPINITDQQFRLIFAYPILFDQATTKLQNQIRDFISVTMLKEIFVSNALNIISTASRINPLIDEKGKEVDVQDQIQKIKFSTEDGFQIDQVRPGSYSSAQATEEIRRRVQEKSAVIKRLLKTDPRLSSLRPYASMITMENMIDVPVIIGTKGYFIDTNTMMFLLIIAISSKQNLSFESKSDVNKMFQILKNTKPENAHNLLNNILTASEENKGIFKRVSGWINQKIESRRSKPIPQEEWKIESEQSAKFLDIAQSKAKQTELFFNFVLDRGQLERQVGINLSQGQSSGVVERVRSDIDKVFNEFESSFIQTISIYGDPAITSFIHMLYPIESGIDLTELRDKHINEKFLTQMQSFIYNDVKTTIENSISKDTPEQSDKKLKELNYLCGDNFKDSDKLLKDFSDNLRNIALDNINFNEDQLDEFSKGMGKVSRKSSTQSKRIIGSLEILLGSGNADRIERKTYSIIKELLSGITREFAFYDPENEGRSLSRFYDSRNVGQYANNLHTSIGSYLTFLFLYNLQIAICQYIEAVKVEVETAKDSIIDFPNYTLVLPVETIWAVSSAFAAKSFEDFTKNQKVSNEMLTLMRRLKDQDIKGIVGYISNKLGIPNVIVIDNQRGKMYYNLMHQTKTQDINLRTLDSYINQITSDVLEN